MPYYDSDYDDNAEGTNWELAGIDQAEWYRAVDTADQMFLAGKHDPNVDQCSETFFDDE